MDWQFVFSAAVALSAIIVGIDYVFHWLQRWRRRRVNKANEVTTETRLAMRLSKNLPFVVLINIVSVGLVGWIVVSSTNLGTVIFGSLALLLILVVFVLRIMLEILDRTARQ